MSPEKAVRVIKSGDTVVIPVAAEPQAFPFRINGK